MVLTFLTELPLFLKFSWCDQSDESDESREHDSVTTQSEESSKEIERVE